MQKGCLVLIVFFFLDWKVNAVGNFVKLLFNIVLLFHSLNTYAYINIE